MGIKTIGYTAESTREAIEIIETRKPLGRFIFTNHDGTLTAIDNTTGDAWTEDFKSEHQARFYLLGFPCIDLYGCLHN